jgi:hypothetical protein
MPSTGDDRAARRMTSGHNSGPNGEQHQVSDHVCRIARGGEPGDCTGAMHQYVPGSRLRIFRVPVADVTRPLALVPPDEIRLAILYVVEDQFGCMREALPRAVLHSSQSNGYARVSRNSSAAS